MVEMTCQYCKRKSPDATLNQAFDWLESHECEPDNAYDEGNKAFYDEKALKDNPYPVTDPNHDKWINGYRDAYFYESGEEGY